MTVSGLYCKDCGKHSATYLREGLEASIGCFTCNYRKPVAPKAEACPQCSASYMAWTWFDPGGCVCGKSRVE